MTSDEHSSHPEKDDLPQWLADRMILPLASDVARSQRLFIQSHNSN